MLIESWRRLNMLSSMCQHVARLQFDSCAEKDSLCGQVMIYDGLNLRCLDQCHGVRSHGTSSSQGCRKIVVQCKYDPWVYILVFPQDDLCRFAMPLWTLVFFRRWASNSQDSPKTREKDPMCQNVARLQFDSCAEKDNLGGTVIFSWNNFIEGFNLIAQMNADWKVEVPVCWVQCAKMWQDCSLTAVQRNTALDIIHDGQDVGINATVFVPMAQAPPRKRIVVQQSKFDRWVYILVFAEGDFCRFA